MGAHSNALYEVKVDSDLDAECQDHHTQPDEQADNCEICLVQTCICVAISASVRHALLKLNNKVAGVPYVTPKLT